VTAPGCAICSRADVERINADITDPSLSWRDLEKRYGIPQSSIRRHSKHFVAVERGRPAASAAIPAQVAEVVDSPTLDMLLGKIQQLEADARRIASTAEAAGRLETAIKAIAQLVRIIEMTGRILGVLEERNRVTVNVVNATVAKMTDAELAKALEAHG